MLSANLPVNSSDSLLLQLYELSDAICGEPEQAIKFAAREGRAFRGALHFDEAAAAGHDDIHVGLAIGIFLVVQIQHGLPVVDADRDGGDPVAQGGSGQQAFGHLSSDALYRTKSIAYTRHMALAERARAVTPIAIDRRAADNLRFIRDTMERASAFTAVPGWGGVAIGLTALFAGTMAAGHTLDQQFFVWLIEALLAIR